MKIIRIDYHESPERISISRLELHPETIELFAELGIVEIKDGQISQADLRRIRKVMRLRRSLGVNLAGASVIVDLLERLEEMEQEIKRLRKAVEKDGSA